METKTIVVVEDEKEMAEFFTQVLRSHGYRVLMANNGREGIETIIQAKPDVVLMDVLMPVVHGGEALSYLRSQRSLGRTKIVLMSSLSPSDFDRFSDSRRDADAYLSKPLSAGRVVQVISELCRSPEDEPDIPPRAPGGSHGEVLP